MNDIASLRTKYFDGIPLTLAETRILIEKADALYYRHNQQTILTDADYDAIKRHLRAISPEDELFLRVGVQYDADEIGTKVQHTIPMGSLDNTDDGILGYDPWYEATIAKLGDEPAGILASLKVDGSSIRARYEHGKLVVVATRGNGELGENVTANGATFQYLPTILPEPITCDVRGEAILYVRDFRILCEADHGMPFDQIDKSNLSNPRNVGNGIVGREDGENSELIRFHAFNIVSDTPYTTEVEKFRHMESLGFTPVPYRFCATPADVHAFYSEAAAERDSLDFEIDGVVVVLDSIAKQDQFITSDIKSRLRPKHSRAIKFPHKSNTTVLDGVALTVGHTGAIIPTAKLREVRVGGVNVTNALLNNWDEIARLGVAIGDEVEVVLAGDIIPKIIRCVKHGANRQPILEPEHCPSCGEPTTRTLRGVKGAVTYCGNSKGCPAAMFAKIGGWVGSSKKGVGILDVGDTMLKALWDQQIVSDPADLYILTVEQIQDVKMDGGGRIGKSRAKKMVDNIAGKRVLPLHLFLGSLGIELLGRRRVQMLAKEANGALDTLEDWLDDAKLAAIQLPGFGDAIRGAIRAGINDNRELIAKLVKNGVSIQAAVPVVAPDANLPFAAFSFCLTGTRECIDDIERLGGSIKSGVSKGLDFLVQKDALSASNKTKKAEELGTSVISLDYLKRAIAGEVTLTREPKDEAECIITPKAAATASKHVHKAVSPDIDSLVDQLVD